MLKKCTSLLASLLLCSSVSAAEHVQATLHTSAGEIVLTLDQDRAPKTVSNFVTYAEQGFYEGLIFHRVIPGFMVQGGGFSPAMARKETRAPIPLEASNGLKNRRGSIAMARTNAPDSATSQFFINLIDNDFLNATRSKPGYTVFGYVTEGMQVVDRIAATPTGNRGSYRDVPLQPITINRVEISQPEQ